MKKILSIEAYRNEDIFSDADNLGRYTEKLGAGVIVCELGEFFEDLPEGTEIPKRMGLGRGFLPYAGGLTTDDPDYKTCGKQDFARMESLNNGEWGYIGVKASARIEVSGVILEITSGGVWGIESDSGEDFIQEIEREQLSGLKGILQELGFSAEEINAA